MGQFVYVPILGVKQAGGFEKGVLRYCTCVGLRINRWHGIRENCVQRNCITYCTLLISKQCQSDRTEDNRIGVHVVRIRKKETPGYLVGKPVEKGLLRRPRCKGKSVGYLNVASNVGKCTFVSTGINSGLRIMWEFLNKMRNTRTIGYCRESIVWQRVLVVPLNRKQGKALWLLTSCRTTDTQTSPRGVCLIALLVPILSTRGSSPLCPHQQ